MFVLKSQGDHKRPGRIISEKRPAAIDQDRLPADKIAERAYQKGHHSRYILGFAQPADRDLPDQGLDFLLIVDG